LIFRFRRKIDFETLKNKRKYANSTFATPTPQFEHSKRICEFSIFYPEEQETKRACFPIARKIHSLKRFVFIAAPKIDKSQLIAERT
jgi:hypothetical protein